MSDSNKEGTGPCPERGGELSLEYLDGPDGAHYVTYVCLSCGFEGDPI